MKHEVKSGQTDYSVLIFIPDSASTDGSGKTGLVAADLTVSGVRVETDNDVTVTDYTASLNNLTLLTDAHTDWGLKEVSNTLAPGLYRLDIADAIFAAGAWSAVVYVMVTTSAAVASPMEFVMVPELPIDGVLLAPTTHTGAVIPTVTTVNGLAANVITAASIATDAIGADEIAAGAVTKIQAGLATPTNITAATGVVLSGVTHTGAVIPTVTTLTGHTPQTGDSYPIVSSATSGNAALKTLIDAVDDLVDTEVAAIYTRLGAPAGASIAADILTKPTAAQIDTQLSGTHGAGVWGSGGLSAGDITAIGTSIASQLGDNPINIQSPTTDDGRLDLVQGMDYYTADGREIEFTFIRDYVPSSCKLTIAAGSVVTVTSTDISESSGSGSGRFHVRFQLPRATGDDLEAGPGSFEVYSIVSGREVAEIAEGVATIRRRLTAAT